MTTTTTVGLTSSCIVRGQALKAADVLEPASRKYRIPVSAGSWVGLPLSSKVAMFSACHVEHDRDFFFQAGLGHVFGLLVVVVVVVVVIIPQCRAEGPATRTSSSGGLAYTRGDVSLKTVTLNQVLNRWQYAPFASFCVRAAGTPVGSCSPFACRGLNGLSVETADILSIGRFTDRDTVHVCLLALWTGRLTCTRCIARRSTCSYSSRAGCFHARQVFCPVPKKCTTTARKMDRISYQTKKREQCSSERLVDHGIESLPPPYK